MSLSAPPVLYDVADMAALARRGRHRLVGPLLVVAAVLMVVLVLLLTAAWLATGVLYVREAVAGLVAFLFFLLIVALSRVTPHLMAWSARRGGALVEQHFSLDDEGFRAESTRGVTLTRWTAVRRVLADDERLFVYIAPRLAYVVPRRVFADEASFRAFAEAAQARFAAARETPA